MNFFVNWDRRERGEEKGRRKRRCIRNEKVIVQVCDDARYLYFRFTGRIFATILSDLYFRLQLDFSTSIIRLPVLEKSGFTVIRHGSFDIPLIYFFYRECERYFK